jgi:hypothetical protein
MSEAASQLHRLLLCSWLTRTEIENTACLKVPVILWFSIFAITVSERVSSRSKQS